MGVESILAPFMQQADLCIAVLHGKCPLMPRFVPWGPAVPVIGAGPCGRRSRPVPGPWEGVLRPWRQLL